MDAPLNLMHKMIVVIAVDLSFKDKTTSDYLQLHWSTEITITLLCTSPKVQKSVSFKNVLGKLVHPKIHKNSPIEINGIIEAVFVNLLMNRSIFSSIFLQETDFTFERIFQSGHDNPFGEIFFFVETEVI